MKTPSLEPRRYKIEHDANEATMEPRLLPRKFKIEHDANEYVYFIELVTTEFGDKWAIQLGISHFYLRKDYGFDFGSCSFTEMTALFDKPSEALEFWKKYIKSRVESSRTAQAG